MVTPRLGWIAFLVVAIVALVVILYHANPSTGVNTRVQNPPKPTHDKLSGEKVVNEENEGEELPNSPLKAMLSVPVPSDGDNSDSKETDDASHVEKKVMIQELVSEGDDDAQIGDDKKEKPGEESYVDLMYGVEPGNETGDVSQSPEKTDEGEKTEEESSSTTSDTTPDDEDDDMVQLQKQVQNIFKNFQRKKEIAESKTGKEHGKQNTIEQTDDDEEETTTGLISTSSTSTPVPTDVPETESSEEKEIPFNRTVVEFKLDFQKDNTSSLLEIFDTRWKMVKAKCKSDSSLMWDHYATHLKQVLNRKRDKRTLMFTSPEDKDEDIKISTCLTPKAGSSFWVDVFTRIAKDDEVKIERKMKLSTINAWKKSDEFQKGLTMITVRNPWARMVSLFEQKIKFEWKKTKSPFHKYMRNVCGIKKKKQLSTFQHLADCIITKANDEHKINRHWQNVYSRCVLCSLDKTEYLIIRIENMMPEAEFYLTKAGYKNSSALLESVRNSTIRPVEKTKRPPYSDYYEDMPDKTIRELQKIFKEDIEMFGYPDTPFSILYKAEEETEEKVSGETEEKVSGETEEKASVGTGEEQKSNHSFLDFFG